MRNIEKVLKCIRYEAAENGIKLAIVPISCLGEVKVDMQMLSEQNDLNGFQKEACLIKITPLAKMCSTVGKNNTAVT